VRAGDSSSLLDLTAILDAVERLAVRDRTRDFRAALELLDREIPVGSSARERLLRGYVLYRLDDDAAGVVALEEATALAGEDERTAFWAALRLCQAHAFHDRDEEAAHCLDRADVLAARLGPEERGQASLARARLLYRADDSRRAADAFAVAETTLDAAGDAARAWKAAAERAAMAAEDGPGRLGRAWGALLARRGRPPPSVLIEIGDAAAAAYADSLDARDLQFLERIALAHRRAAEGAKLDNLAFALANQGEVKGLQAVAALAARVARSPGGRAVSWLAQVALAGAMRSTRRSRLLDRALEALRAPGLDPHLLIMGSRLAMDAQRDADAQELCSRVITLPTSGEQVRSYARVNLAGVCIRGGRLEEAFANLQAVRRDLLPIQFLVVYHLNLAGYWLMRGFPEEARANLAAAMKLPEIPDPEIEAITLVNACGTALQLDDAPLCRTLEKRIAQVIPWAQPQSAGSLLVNQGELHERLGQVRKARRCYEAALRGGLELPGGMSLTASLALARVSDLLDDGPGARRALRGALRLARRWPQRRAAVHWAAAHRALAEGDVAVARRQFHACAREERRIGAMLWEADTWLALSRLDAARAESVATARKAYRLCQAALGLMGAEHRRLEVLERYRHIGGWLVAMLLDHRTPRAALEAAFEVKSGELLGALVARGHAPAEAVAGEPYRLPEVALEIPATTSGLLRHGPAHQAHGTRRSLDAWDRMTRERSWMRPRPGAVGRVLASLAADEVAIEWYLADPNSALLVAWVLRDGEVHLIDETWRPRHDKACRRALSAILVAGEAPDGAAEMLGEAMGQLERVLFAPVRDLVAGKRRLFLAPGGVLGHVPLEWWFDGYEVGHLPSLALLPDLPPTRGAMRQALVVRGADRHGAAALPASDVEAARVSAALKAAGVEVLQAPSSPDVLGGALSQVDLFHYAGHATFDAESGMAAALQLEGGAFEAWRFQELVLARRPLVVLSGCDTGRFKPMGDELVGFVRALFLGGASGVVCASWPVNDGATAALMDHFYSRLLAGELATRAMQDAASALRAAGLANPVHWGSFRVYGR